jgi:dTDP-4-amino-4,6-dideoxygalactose transaminase
MQHRPLATLVAPQPLALPSDQDATGRTFGPEELDALKEVLDRGTLVSTKGPAVKDFEHRIAALLGIGHATASSSGTAAIHAAVAALDPEPGDEIVTTPITDMGALTPILYQGAIPVFADVDPRSCNVTAEMVEAALSPRTKAIVVTHLFGGPCDMDPILAVAARAGVPVIEDCAQAYMARSQGRLVGTLGTLGCFTARVASPSRPTTRWPAASTCGSTRATATATRSPTTSSWR